MERTEKGKSRRLLLIYSVLYWIVILISRVAFEVWQLLLFVTGLMLIEVFSILYYSTQNKGQEEGNKNAFYRLSPRNDFWVNTPLLIWALVEIYMGNELFWMYAGLILFLIGFPLIRYLLDRKYRLQKIIVGQEKLTIVEGFEVSYSWEWLDGRCQIEGDSLLFERKFIERNKYDLSKYQDKNRLISSIEKNLKSKSRMKILVIVGPPYSGKGTQCEVLEKVLGYKHISTGEIIREEKVNKTQIGEIMSVYEEKGELVPDSIMKNLCNEILKRNKGEDGVILDGYPRTIPQVDDLIELLSLNNLYVDQVLSIEVPADELLNRAKKRAETSNRQDDKDVNTHIKRIEVFESNSRPAIDYMKNKLAVESIRGIGTVEEITDRIMEKIIK